MLMRPLVLVWALCILFHPLSTEPGRAQEPRPRLVAQTGHAASINAVAASADGRKLVTGSSDGTARLWEMATGKEVRTFQGHTDSVTCVTLSKNGKVLVTGSYDRSVR